MSMLPSSGDLPIGPLAACFDDTTASYKFYWFLALLDHVQEGGRTIVDIRELLVRMVASVWFPVNRFRLSFGKQDRLSLFALEMAGVAQLPGTVTLSEIEHELLHAGLERDKQLSSLGRYVPKVFLTPWFSETLRGVEDKRAAIVRLAEEKFDEIPCLYRFTPDRRAIELHPRWLAYLQTHLEILRRFAQWSLVCFLQSRNVNVPNIGAKLMSPAQRNLKAARDFWSPLIREHPELRCIYSGDPLTAPDYDLDHFVPWSFVTHDQMWNLCPVVARVNSAKGDALPSMARYFTPFAEMQQLAVRALRARRRHRIMEDYVLLFEREPEAICDMNDGEFRRRLEERIVPLMQVASNLGFSQEWTYRPDNLMTFGALEVP